MADKFFAFLKDKFNIALTDAQKKAVAQKDGKIVLISTPGSGKTTCNVCRCANLILTHGVKPENIMSVTFSRAAAIDMENRFNKLFGNIIRGRVKFSTIHGFALKVINDYSRLSGVSYKVIEGSTNNDENSELGPGEFEAPEGINKIPILKKIYYSVNKEYISDDKMEDLLGAIGYVSNMMIRDEEIAKMNFGIPKFSEINSIYKNFLNKNNYLDYDHMLTKAYEVLKSSPSLLKSYRNQYKYIQVDEAQDTSNIQHEIIYLLSRGSDNILFVGDDDQSIYEWRGANPDALLNIDKRYPGAKIIYMEENFRSTKKIVSAANEFIKANQKRYNKNLYTNNKEGSPISIVNLNDGLEQIDYLINVFKKGGTYSDHAVLFRNNVSAISLADALDKHGIPNAKKEKLSGMEEERRLFYVGMTRARDSLTLVTINNKNGESVPRSSFVDELDNILKPKKLNTKDELRETLKHRYGGRTINGTAITDYNSLCRGDIVTHIKFGSGPITNIDIKKDLIEIKFYDCGERKLSINACKENNLLVIG